MNWFDCLNTQISPKVASFPIKLRSRDTPLNERGMDTLPARKRRAASLNLNEKSLLKRPKLPKQKPGPRAEGPRNIPDDVWKMFLPYMTHSMRPLLMLSMVCRGARDAVLLDYEFWYQVCRRVQHYSFWGTSFAHVGRPVVRNIPMTPYPNFKLVEGSGGKPQGYRPPWGWIRKESNWPNLYGDSNPINFNENEKKLLAQHMLRCARIQSAKSCGLCGSRTRHIEVWGLGCRACSSCLKANLVSSAALYADYGFDFMKHLDAIAGKVFYCRVSCKREVTQYLSYNPVDFRAESRDHLVFFWKPHLEKHGVIHFSQARRDIQAKSGAARVLQAASRALHARVTMMQRGRAFTCETSHYYLFSAKAWQARKLQGPSDEDARVVKQFLPPAYKTRQLLELELRARRILQSAFLRFGGRVTLPAAENRRGVLESLRTHEAVRESSLREQAPTRPYGEKFQQWLDCPPLP